MNAPPELERNLNWLLNHSLQAGLLVLLVLVVQWVFRRRLSHRWRFALWWVVLLRLLLPFSVSSVVSLFNYVQPSVQVEGPRYSAPMPLPAPDLTGQTDLPGLTEERPAKAPVVIPPHSWSRDDFLIPGLAGLWAAGVLGLSCLVARQWIRFYGKLAAARPPADPSLQVLLDDCRRDFGLSRPIQLLETDAVESPALFGVLRPRLLIPRGLGAQFSGREWRYVFLHELAHVKRGDLWLNWLVTALQIAHWFNPLLWVGFARLRADRELACDELALLRAGDRAGTAYGETVVKLLEKMSRPAAIPGLVGILEDRKLMRRRISMIANFRAPGRWSVLAALLTAVVAVAALTDAPPGGKARPDLTGHVFDKKGKPLPVPATVFIATAAPKTGSSTFCPSCYADCVKHEQTDARGAFKIKSLDPQLTFRILAVAPGYQPRYVSKVDPVKGEPVKVELQPIEAGDAAPDRSVRGRVVNTKGEPIEGAVVEMRGVETKDGAGTWGKIGGVDPLAVTDAKGEFLITAKKHFDMMSVKVTARMYAAKGFDQLASGAERHDLELTEGAALTGRVLLHGKPMAGVSVGLSGVERSSESYLGHFEVGTDAEGRFAFVNLPSEGDFLIYSIMDSMRGAGAVPQQRIHTARDGGTTTAGDLMVEPANRLAGRVVLSDGHPAPARTRLLIGDEGAWDSTQVMIDNDGSFEASGIPSGLVVVSTRVKGYHLSGRNLSVDQLNPFRLIGRVDHDITNLVILLEKGPDVWPDYSHTAPDYGELRGRPLRGAEGVADHSLDWAISGHVIDSETKQPVRDFLVTPGQRDFNQTGWNAMQAFSSSNGIYQTYISKRVPQPLLKVDAEGYLPAAREVLPQDAADVNFVLTKGSGVEGVVVTPDGKPAVGASVILLGDGFNQGGFDSHGELTTYQNKPTHANAVGHFSFKPIWGMKSIAAASSNGFAVVSLQSFATNSAITLEPFGKITGTLKRASAPGTNENLSLRFDDTNATGLNVFRLANTDAAGHFEFDDVPAGHLKISSMQKITGQHARINEPLQEVDLKPGQTLVVNISAPNLAPEDSPYIRPQQSEPPKLIPGVFAKGVVLLPDGLSAADADVALQVDGKYLGLEKGAFSQSNLREEGLMVSTGPDGSFTLPMYERAKSVVALNEAGYAQVSLGPLKASPEIKLQKWGRIEGVLRVGHHPDANEGLVLEAEAPRWSTMRFQSVDKTHYIEITNSEPEPLAPPHYDPRAFQVKTDDQGRFVMTFVPPGKEIVSRKVPTGHDSWMFDRIAIVEVKPGETIVTNLGGPARTVVGKVKFADGTIPNAESGSVFLRSPYDKFQKKFHDLKTDEERKKFYQSGEYLALRTTLRLFNVALQPDGSFRAADVAPGSYEVTYQSRGGLFHDTLLNNYTSHQEFTVPEAKGRNDDSAVQWGEIKLEKASTPSEKVTRLNPSLKNGGK